MAGTTVAAYVLLLVMTLATGSILFWSIRLGIGPTPTSRRVSQVLKKALPGRINGDIVELGCGWGTLLPILKQQYPRNRIIAFERSPVPALWATLTTGIPITRNDFFTADLGHPGLIVCYLYPGAMKRLEEEVIPGLPEGCWILTHTFRLPGWQPVKTLYGDDLYKTPVYLYQKIRIKQ